MTFYEFINFDGLVKSKFSPPPAGGDLGEGDKPFFTPTFVLPRRRGRIYWGNFKYAWLDIGLVIWDLFFEFQLQISQIPDNEVPLMPARSIQIEGLNP